MPINGKGGVDAVMPPLRMPISTPRMLDEQLWATPKPDHPFSVFTLHSLQVVRDKEIRHELSAVEVGRKSIKLAVTEQPVPINLGSAWARQM